MLEAAELAKSKARHPSQGTGKEEPQIRHLIVNGAEPHLYDCFNQCDLLISDISSVVTDFLASEKPYAVTNVASLPGRVFYERYPSAEAGVLRQAELARLQTEADAVRTAATTEARETAESEARVSDAVVLIVGVSIRCGADHDECVSARVAK